LSVDVVAFGAHPDDVELGCGGTLARLVAEGRRAAIVSLTRGEAGTRGTPELRCEEAREAARCLGVQEVVFLDCGDAMLTTGPEQEDQVLAVLRRLRPEVVFAPPPTDRHPDHGRACRLVSDACFYSGLVRRGDGVPHRPGLLLSYQLHDSFEPTLIIDIAASWETKLSALSAHRSQFFLPSAGASGTWDQEAGSATKIASTQFWRGVEARARHWGLQVGCDFGEPFLAHGPLAVNDLFSLIQQSHR
jgi:bacillithiol biosynthesis deacetylase BshB1